MSKVAIIGCGAIGGPLAAHLHAAGKHEVTVCSRRDIPGMRVETPGGTLPLPSPVLTNPAQASPVDFVLVATKAYETASTAAWFSRLAPAGVPVAILQNGVEHQERFAPYLALDRIVPVIVWFSAERPAPDRIQQRSNAKLTVPDNMGGRALAELFKGTPVTIELTADFKSVAWRKLCGNAAGIVNTLIRQPTGALQDDAIAEMVRAVAHETAAVGRAEGAVLPDDIADAIVRGLRSTPPDSVNSMQADREAGRPLELDARNGVVVRLGRKHGIPTPYNLMAVTFLEALLRHDRRP